jgi:protein SCO1/2
MVVKFMTNLSGKKHISSLIGLFALLLISFLLFTVACSQSPKVTPTPSVSQEVPPTPFVSQEEAMPALPFELTNQFGQTTSLAQLKSKVVVLTFLYTNCPDACPLIISHIEQAMTELGSLADGVALVVITVDPERDTVERLQEFTASLAFDWQYLTGEPEQVKAVWASYGIYVEKQEEETTAEGQSHSGHQGYGVNHTTVVMLIDKEGLQRSILLGLYWQVAELEEKLRLLLSE